MADEPSLADTIRAAIEKMRTATYEPTRRDPISPALHDAINDRFGRPHGSLVTWEDVDQLTYEVLTAPRPRRRATRPVLSGELCRHDRLMDEWVTEAEFSARFFHGLRLSVEPAMPDGTALIVAEMRAELLAADPRSFVWITGV